MSKCHWKRMINLEYLGAYALDEGEDKTLTIDHVAREKVTGNNGRSEECLVCHWRENERPMILNRTNCKTITKVVGSPYIEDWQGKSVILYADVTRLAGESVECLRIRNYAPRATDKVLKCAECGKDISGKGSMSASEVAAYTKRTFGKQLCSECAKKAQEG